MMMIGVLVVAGLAVSFFLLISTRSHPLYKGWSSSAAQSKVALISPDALQISVIFLSILSKYLPGTTGYNTRLIADSKGKGFDLQPVSLHGPIIITEKDIDKFNLAVSRKSNQSNTQQLNPMFLVSFTTPLLLFILSNHSCPIRPLGAVNTRNRFEFEDASFCRDSKALLAASQSGSLSYSCKFGGDELFGRRRKRGVEFDIVVEVKKESRVIFRQYISALQFLSSKHAPRFNQQDHADSKAAPSKEPVAASNESEASDLNMDSSDPHRWAASCKDYNPIHMSSLAAKVFGFRSAIAHGNHAVALAAQQSFVDGPKSGKKNDWDTKSKYQLEVTFVKPMLLPAKLSVSWTGNNEHTQLRMTAKDTLVVTGELTS